MNINTDILRIMNQTYIHTPSLKGPDSFPKDVWFLPQSIIPQKSVQWRLWFVAFLSCIPINRPN